jgi:hypothetical protein
MSPTTRGTLTLAIAALLIAACGGDEYNENGQLVEKTDVRVVGVDFGPAVDSLKRVTDEADAFLPGDTIYASVRTKGSSPKTVLGVRWKNPSGDEISTNNIAIRPAGDISTVFALYHLVALDTGDYTLAMRVNGQEVKTASFTVTKGAERHHALSREASQEVQTRVGATRSFARKTFAQMTGAVASLFDRATNEQSPFEWKGLRAGMSFSRLDRLSQPGTPWKCMPFFMSAVGLDRSIALESDDFGAGRVIATVDTVGRRVLDVNYSVSWVPHDNSRTLDFERELTALAIKWDKMPGVIRHPRNEHEGPSSTTWQTPDSLWSARISYDQSHGVVRPGGFEIEEIQYGDRLTARITDSMKGQMRNPQSDYYRRGNNACDALLRGQKWVPLTQ